MLKYVRLVQGHAEAFIFAGAPLSHAELVRVAEATGWRPASAGFVQFGPACGVTTHDRSESLNLDPHAEDARKIQILYQITGDDIRAREEAAANPPPPKLPAALCPSV